MTKVNQILTIALSALAVAASHTTAAAEAAVPLGAAATLLDLAHASLPPKLPPGLPIPAGSTLVDVSDSGNEVLFSSLDPNVVAGQESIPTTSNLYWADLARGIDEIEIRLVTHFAGSVQASTGFIGVGNGLVQPFEALSADLSSDGRTVVFDSRVNAHDYDATVPAENDQPTLAVFYDVNLEALNVPGTVDVFTWSADAADPANNISAVSLLSRRGKRAAVELQPQPAGMPGPDARQPMVIGIFPEQQNLRQRYAYPPIFVRDFVILNLTTNHGISSDGSRVLYDTMVPAGWIDWIRRGIKDAMPPKEPTTDAFLVNRGALVGAASVERLHDTRTVTLDKDRNALGHYESTMPLPPQPVPPPQMHLPNEYFEALYPQLSGDGNRVAYSTRRTGADVVPGVVDSDLSLDVFAYDVPTDQNVLVSRFAGDPARAAGSAQPNYDPNVYVTNSTVELFDSMNHAISEDGDTIVFSSSAANLIAGMVDNNVELSERIAYYVYTSTPPYTPVVVNVLQSRPFDFYAFRAGAGATHLINTPNGIANTNLNATFDGMSSDGKTFLFSTAGNNFYEPPFSDPHYPPFAGGPLPPNFLLGGFNHLWARDVDTNASTLISTGADGKSSGNEFTSPSPVLPGARDTLANVSSNGRFVLFSSASNNLAAGINDPAGKGGQFVRDRVAGVTTLMSTRATGNVPSAGLFTASALGTDDAAGTTRVFLGGTNASDMQTRYRSEDVRAGAHVYGIEYPRLSPASSATNPAVVAVSGDYDANLAFEYRGTKRTIRAALGALFPGHTRAARVATGDVNGDGTVDYVYGAGPGYGPVVVVKDGRTNADIARFLAFRADFQGGIYVGAGDVDRDGYADVIVGTGPGIQATINVFSGKRGYLLDSIDVGGWDGARVAGGDVDGDGHADIIAGSSELNAPEVRVYSGQDRTLMRTIAVTDAMSVTPRGIYVAAADMDGDGQADIVTGSDVAPAVRLFDGATGAPLPAFPALPGAYAGGVRVAARAGLVIVGSGPSDRARMHVFAQTPDGGWKVVDRFIYRGPYSAAAELYVG